MTAWNMFRIWSRAEEGRICAFSSNNSFGQITENIKKSKYSLLIINQMFLLPLTISHNLKPWKCQLFIDIILVKKTNFDGLEKIESNWRLQLKLKPHSKCRKFAITSQNNSPVWSTIILIAVYKYRVEMSVENYLITVHVVIQQLQINNLCLTLRLEPIIV